MKFPKLNQQGFGLIEVLITLAIVGMSALVMMSLQKTNITAARQGQLINTAQQNHARILNLLKDNNTWNNTMANNPSMSCLLDKVSCAGVGTDVPFNIYGGGDPTLATVAFSSLASKTANGPGFNESGAPCIDHNPTDGNVNCPIGYYITWTPDCSGTCINPPILIRVLMSYKVPPDSIDPSFNPNKYSIGYTDQGATTLPFTRTVGAMTQSFRLNQLATGGGTGGGGVCPPISSMASRELIETSVDGSDGDPLGMVDPVGTGGIQLKNPGTYKCTGMALGFGVNGFQIQLVVDGAVVGSGVGFAPKWVQGTATFETSFTVPTKDKVMYFRQGCEASATPVDQYGMGMPISPYTVPAVYATLVCSLIN